MHPPKLIIEYGQVRTENANKPHGFGVLNPVTFTPFPKNPVIGAFFREIHRADELGSGTRKLMRYGKIYGGTDPELIEGDIFRVMIKVPEFNLRSINQQESLQPELESGLESRLESGLESGLAARILIALKNHPLGKSQIAKILGHKSTSSALHKQIRKLLSNGLIEMTLPEKPNSRLQQYCLTNKSQDLIQSSDQGG